jgi:hypothetical protein
MATSGASSQRDVVKACFGATLSDLGRGFFVALELFAILRGTWEMDGDGLLPPPSESETAFRYLRRSHDFARRMPTDPVDLLFAEERSVLDGEATRTTLGALVDALTVPFPGSRGPQPFKRRLLFPYVGELVHYDAVDRPSRRADVAHRISLERYTYRGAGGLAHKMLRTDPSAERLQRNRRGLAELVCDSGTALGRLAMAMRSHDREPSNVDEPFEDTGEATASLRIEGQRWVEALRGGVANIVERNGVPRAKRVELLLHWIPYCVARYQLDVARAISDEGEIEIPIDLRATPNTIRRASQVELARCPVVIGEALARTAARLAAEQSDEVVRRSYEQVAASGLKSGTNLKSARAFFTSTLWGVGALNAPSGLRHFTLHLPMIEALVAASLAPGQDMAFGEFAEDVLFRRYGLVVDHGSGRRSSLGDHIDTAEFEENGEILARKLAALGLLTEYSDATRVVHAEVRR